MTIARILFVLARPSDDVPPLAAPNPGDASKTPMSQAGRGYPAATSSLSTSVSMPSAEVPSAAGFRG